jgi:protein gp37
MVEAGEMKKNGIKRRHIMNRTKIEWVRNDDGTQGYTWNPVTGCLHGCKYCYARGIARRFGCDNYNGKLHEISQPVYRYKGDKPSKYLPFPYGFDPTFHRYRLDEPQKVKKPSTIFVGSMTDLFGEWVPDEWIAAVFEACAKVPQHRYIFLTKNPKRYYKLFDEGKLKARNNFWFGITLTSNNDTWKVNYTKFKGNIFYSIEPILDEKVLNDVLPYYTHGVEWVILGTESGNRKNKFMPTRQCLEYNISLAKREGNNEELKIFMKDSLKDIWGEPLIQQMPWGVV